MNWNPIPRGKPLRYKPREHKESWRSGKIRLSGREMARLREDAYSRSFDADHGYNRCENSFGDSKKRCATRIYWGTFHLAHIISRGRGGSDVLSNVLAACPDCHQLDTLNKHKLQPHADWIP